MANARIALVTGAASGMGQGVVARLVADGFHVAAMDVNENAVNALMAKSSTGVTPYLCDQTDEAATISASFHFANRSGHQRKWRIDDGRLSS